MTQASFLKKFSRRLTSIRQQKGLSQEELADRAGLHVVAITYIETGKRTPKIDTIYKIAKGLGVRVDELFKDL